MITMCEYSDRTGELHSAFELVLCYVKILKMIILTGKCLLLFEINSFLPLFRLSSEKQYLVNTGKITVPASRNQCTKLIGIE